MNLLLLVLAVAVIGVAIGLMTHYLVMQVKPGPVRVLAIDPMGGPPDYVKAQRRTGALTCTIHGREARIPLAEGIGHPWRGGTLYIVDASSGIPYDMSDTEEETEDQEQGPVTATHYRFKAFDKRLIPAHLDAFRIAGEAMSANHEQLQRSEPEGMFGFLAKAMPVLMLLAVGILLVVLFAAGRLAGWW